MPSPTRRSTVAPTILRVPVRLMSPATSSFDAGAGTPRPMLPLLATRNFEVLANHEVDGAAQRDVVDPILVRRVAEPLELPQRPVLVVEQHAGVGVGRAAQVLHRIAGVAAVAVVERHMEDVAGRGGAQADRRRCSGTARSCRDRCCSRTCPGSRACRRSRPTPPLQCRGRGDAAGGRGRSCRVGEHVGRGG